MTPLTLTFYAWTCGWTLARAHRAERDGGQETNGLEPGEYRAVNVGLHKPFRLSEKDGSCGRRAWHNALSPGPGATL